MDEETAKEEVAKKARAQQKTLDNMREKDETMVDVEDDEIAEDDARDEFAPYYSDIITPKIMISTRPKASSKLYEFIRELMVLIPNAYLYKRLKGYDIKDMVQYASNQDFTHLIILGEKSKVCNQMLVIHLPFGPTALFKVTSIVHSKNIPEHGKPSDHVPELIMKNFGTRLGHRMGRFLGSLFPHKPEFVGRQVVTFHNQRDFVFLRQHRYIFEEEFQKVRLQELGPRLTLKLKWISAGTFDKKHGEMEWVHRGNKKILETSKTRFHL